MGPDRWNWTRRDGGRIDDESQTALLQDDHITASPSFSPWAPSHSRSSRSSSRSGSSSSESLLDETTYTLDGTPPYSLKTCHNATARRNGCFLFNNLARIPASLALYLQLQLRHRLGITFALPIKSFPTPRRPFRKHVVILWCICALILIPVLLLGVILIYGGIPPSYSEIRAAERALPQHHWDWDKWKGAKSSERVASHLVRGGTFPGSVNGIAAGQSAESLKAYDERYLRFPDHLWGHGLNNVLQEAILTSHLTLLSNRTPVFEDYTWSHLPVQYTLYDFALRPTRIPLGAFVGGVLAGQDGVHDMIENEKRERRAVSAAYFEYVCPPSETVEVVYRWPGASDAPGYTLSEEDNQGKTRYTEGDTTPPIIRAPSGAEHTPSLLAKADDATSTYPDSTPTSISPAQSTPSDLPPFPSWQANGNEIIEWFEKRLAAADVKDKRCVVVREERRVFDAEFFGTEKILGLLPELLSSPVLRQFEWSALARGAVERNVQRFFGAKAKAISPSAPAKTDGDIETNATATPAAAPKRSIITVRASAPGANHTLSGVLALHLRRGDYKRHCTRLKEWGTRYLGVMNLLEDKFDGEHGRPRETEVRTTGVKESEEEREERRTAYYLEHCLPSVEQVVLRLREVREEYEDTLRVARRLESDAEAEEHEPNDARAEYALRDVYVLTNGWPSFVTELREALVADGWSRVVGTPDWESAPAPVRFAVNNDRSADTLANEEDEEDLNSEERGVSAAIDMGIAERAEVFVGNGFSSLSSNVIMLRLAKGLAIHSNRML